MFNIHRLKTPFSLYLKALTFPPFSLNFCTKTSDSTSSFAVSYLIHNFGFSPQSASKLCSTYNLRFKTTQKPDSVLTLFTNHGFSDSQLHHIILRAPWLLSCNPCKRVLPKFQFFLSKGVSHSDIVKLVTKSPAVLSASLKNQIVPTYELTYRFLQSHNDTIACLISNPSFFRDKLVQRNIILMIKNGVADANIARLIRVWSQIFQSHDMLKLVEELKDLGFNPSKTTFGVALAAKASVSKTHWKEKVDTFKKWGSSDENVREAFRKQPHCMLVSIDKINLVMNFWVNQMGWDPMVIVKTPNVLSSSLEKKIIPRATIVQYLLNKGLRDKDASLISPFIVPEKYFLDMFIKRFEKDSSYLLKLYEEKLNAASTRDKSCIS